MNFFGLIFLLAAHVLCGKGMLRLLKVIVEPIASFCISIMIGVVLLSFVPCFLQLVGLAITDIHAVAAVVIMTAICSIPLMRNFKRPQLKKILLPALYEWPFLVAFAVLLFVSAWRCFYFPPTPRDMLTGPEVVAEFAVREQTMVNSVFSLDLHLSNNYFKSPFITGLQILYKLLVCPFGQIWLSVLYIAFIVWLYTILKKRIHPVFAGMLLLFFITVPDLYAYSFLMLYDYSNMIFFFAGFYFLASYATTKNWQDVLFSAFLLGLATFIRTETLILIGMILPLLAIYFYKEKLPVVKSFLRLGIFMAIPAAFYFLCINVFVKNIVPIPFDVAGQMNQHLADITPFFKRIKDINTELIFSSFGLGSYGYFIYFFCGVLLVDLIWPRRFNREARVALYGIVVVYIGLPFIGYLFPLADLMNTTKRGLFKLFPLMLFYIANSSMVLYLSERIKKWEFAQKMENKI
jgi:hypothetical protein